MMNPHHHRPGRPVGPSAGWPADLSALTRSLHTVFTSQAQPSSSTRSKATREAGLWSPSRNKYVWWPPGPPAIPSPTLTHELALVLQGGFSVVLDVAVNADGTKIMVADLMRSVSLLHYDTDSHAISVVARDTTPRWLSAAFLVEDEGGASNTTRVVFADSNFNLGFLEQTPNAADEDIVRLKNIGEIYTGEFINRFRVGSLSNLSPMNTLIFGTISGKVGLIAPLTQNEHALLKRLQAALEEVIGAIGGFDVKAFRSPCSTIGRLNPTEITDASIVDGDIVETYLQLDAAGQENVMKGAGFDTSEGHDAVALVLKLARLK